MAAHDNPASVKLACEWPTPKHPCQRQVVAKIGLPGPGAIWVCNHHFAVWQRGKQPRGGAS